MKTLTTKLQRRIAEECLTPSLLRVRGDLDPLRDHCGRLDLRAFQVASERRFQTILGQCSERLRETLPPSVRQWGRARKVLNAFLRDCLYNKYVCDFHGLLRIESFLEVPLDKMVVEQLQRLSATEPGRPALPRWRSLKTLGEADHIAFQAEALRQAQRAGTFRVHLDLLWWSPKPREEDAA